MPKQNAVLSLGIDLGGTKILTAVADEQGHLLERDYRPTPAEKGQDAVLDAIAQSVRKVLKQSGQTMNDMAGIGIGAPGPSNPRTGILYSSPNLPGWRDVPLQDMLADEFDRPTFLINDANAAALAEYHFGGGRHACCFIYVTVSTGIGGGIVIDGDIYTGSAGSAGEIGHMTIDDKGPACNCGNNGCWETLASGSALAERARARLVGDNRSIIADYAGGEPAKVTAKHIHQAAQAGDPLARELLMTTSHYLGTGFANLINLFNPDIIAVGGGMSRMGDLLLGPAYAVAESRAFSASYAAVQFVPAKLGGDSGVLGAAIHATRSVRNS